MSREGQLHPTFPAYQRWVISKLVGIFATDDTNVLPHIVMRWIDQNQDYLQQFEISYQQWRGLQAPQGVVKALIPLREGREEQNPGEGGKA
jgi:hypothetical protein